MTADQPAKWTVLELLNWTKSHLGHKGVHQARLASEVLLAHALGCERIELYTRFDYEPTPAQREAFRELVRRASEHEPIAYLVGAREFYSLRMKVTPDVLIPRPETEGLVDEALAHLRQLERPARVWDVGTGSGCIAIAIAVNSPEATVLATDISPAALAVAAENAQAHGVSDRVTFAEADLLSRPPAAGDGKFDLIVSNPPYVGQDEEVADEVLHEPVLALRADKAGLSCLRRVIEAAPAQLHKGGALGLEFGFGQADAVRDLIVATGAFDEPDIVADRQDLDRIAVAIRR